MKKIIFGLIALFGISSFSFGQLTLENSYSTLVWTDETNVFKTETGINYYTLDNATNILKIYNDAHILNQTINLSVPTNYRIGYILYPSDKLFNADALIEFVIRFDRLSSAPTTLPDYRLSLINQNNIIIQQFGNRADAKVIRGVGSSLKFVVSGRGNNFTGLTTPYDIYTLTGTLSTIQLKMPSNLLIGFPNPTSNIFTIINNLEKYESSILEVYDLNGKKMLEKIVKGENDTINLDISTFASGTYIYKLNGQTNKLIKN